jgi:putative CRISPR-associated protein (TIGR02619 family)
MTKPLYILSPCGTSVLTNCDVPDQQKRLIYAHSNKKNPDDIPARDRTALEDIIARADRQLRGADPARAAELSAEINCLSRIQRPIHAPPVTHQLICTDTWLGEQSARLIQQWWQKQGDTVMLERQNDLQTSDSTSFQLAMSELVRWMDEEINQWKPTHKIIFNLTGGFKSIQGFLQTLASFYADETIYIFETGTELISIPRLPIKMETMPVMEQHLAFFRRMDNEFPVSSVPEAVPKIFLLIMDGEVDLSPWGELVWKQVKREIYEQEIHDPPCELVQFGPDFRKSIRGLDPHRRYEINKKIDELCRFQYTNQQGNPVNLQSLDVKAIKGGQQGASTHECDAWHDQDARRIFMHYERQDGAKMLILDQLGKALH